MKYFFLAEGWDIGRIWEFGGLWNVSTWRRQPHLQRLQLYLVEGGQRLWLHEVEDAVLMLEVKPGPSISATETIGQVTLKRLITAEQVISRLAEAEAIARADRDSSPA